MMAGGSTTSLLLFKTNWFPSTAPICLLPLETIFSTPLSMLSSGIKYTTCQSNFVVLLTHLQILGLNINSFLSFISDKKILILWISSIPDSQSLTLIKVFLKGKIGEFYNIGSGKNLNNIQISKAILKIAKNFNKIGNKTKIKFVKDRPGHDLRYALNSNKIKKELKWKPKISFNKGIKLTFEWYKNNKKYYKSLKRKDIIRRLGTKWSEKELF